MSPESLHLIRLIVAKEKGLRLQSKCVEENDHEWRDDSFDDFSVLLMELSVSNFDIRILPSDLNKMPPFLRVGSERRSIDYYQPLFNLMSRDHGLNLLQDEMNQIINTVQEMMGIEEDGG